MKDRTIALIEAAESVSSMRAALPGWTVEEVPARATGNNMGPGTNAVMKVTRVPFGDSELDKLVRAHELAHIAVTPFRGDWNKYAPVLYDVDDLIHAEEGRINFLVSQVFDTTMLYDGDEINLTIKSMVTGKVTNIYRQLMNYGYTGAGLAICEVIKPNRWLYEEAIDWMVEMRFTYNVYGDKLYEHEGLRAASDVAFKFRTQFS